MKRTLAFCRWMQKRQTVEWPYLFDILCRYRCGPKFCRWIKLLYCEPLAEVITNNVTSESFSLSRGRCHGCQLSPLLFVMIFEPLAISIRNHPEIKGILISDQEHQISWFADDILLCLSYLRNSIQYLPQLIWSINLEHFRVTRSISLNLFFFSINKKEIIQQSSILSVAKDGFKYLGITITPQIKNIIPCNYDPIIAQVKDSLDRWMSLPLTIIGRINVIKMNIFPKVLYLFQSIPLTHSPGFFSSIHMEQKMIKTMLNTTISAIWQGGSSFITFYGILGRPGLNQTFSGALSLPIYLGFR